MKIALCGSLTFHKEMRSLQHVLEEKGFTVFVPKSFDLIEQKGFKKPETVKERLAAEAKYDFIREHFDKIKKSDVVLVANYDKKGIAGYIGGNTFLEIGYGYYLHKQIYFLHEIPAMIYTLELAAMRPTILNGDLSKLS